MHTCTCTHAHAHTHTHNTHMQLGYRRRVCPWGSVPKAINAMTHPYAWHDSFYAWHDSFVCNVTPYVRSYVWHNSLISVTWLVLCVTWLLHRDVTPFVCSYAWHDSFVCDMTPSYGELVVAEYAREVEWQGSEGDARHDSLKSATWLIQCVTWLIHMWHHSFRHVPWLFPFCDMTHSRSKIVVAEFAGSKALSAMTHPYVWHDSIYVWHDSFNVWHDSFICSITPSNVCHDSFHCVAWHIHTVILSSPSLPGR